MSRRLRERVSAALWEAICERAERLQDAAAARERTAADVEKLASDIVVLAGAELLLAAPP